MESNLLEHRIAALQAELLSMQGKQPSAQQLVPETTEDMVKRLIDERLTQVITPIVDANAAQQPMDFGASLLQAIGSGLTEQQQQWLSMSENLSAVPEFLKTTEGQALTRRFFNNYSTYVTTQ
jgi:hypothetical protein